MVHSGGKLWLNDAGNFVIREIDLSNMAVSTLSGSVGNNGFQSGSAGNSRYDSMLGMTLITHNLFITEGARKADAAVSKSLCCVDLLGVWNWRRRSDDR